MQDRPTAAELLGAVRAFLEDDVMQALEGRMRFQTRVAANILGILEREWAGDEAATRAELDRVAALLGTGASAGGYDGTKVHLRELHAVLAGRIRAGEMDDRWDETLRAVYAGIVDKLAIANPGYAEDPSRA